MKKKEVTLSASQLGLITAVIGLPLGASILRGKDIELSSVPAFYGWVLVALASVLGVLAVIDGVRLLKKYFRGRLPSRQAS